jgi:hypothetical protein
MKTLIAKAAIAALGLSLAVAPIAASAAPWGVGVTVGGPGYVAHAGYVNPGGPCYGCYHHWAQPHNYNHPYGWRPAGPAYYEGFYGWAPGGFYGYYSRGGWYHHRRWGPGFWIYF